MKVDEDMTVGEERVEDASREHPTKWGYTLRKAANEFSRDQGTDLAAGLTYYSVLSIFPALVALVSLLGVFGKKGESANTILQTLRDMGQNGAADTLKDPITQMTQTSGAGIALIIGVLGALWSASGYVGAFGRMMNRVYDVPEGRGFFRLRPVQLLLTLVCILGALIVLLGLAVSGPVAQTVGDKLGLGSSAVTAWNIAKWPVILLVVIALVAMLYHFTPNVRRPKFRFLSPGAVIAIVVWILASVAFGFYVANFGKYNKTYGALAGVIVFLLWIWLTNVALVFGAEVDAESERSRQLQAGIAAEENLQLPMRSVKKAEKDERKRKKHIAKGRELREEAVAAGVAAGDAGAGLAGASRRDGKDGDGRDADGKDANRFAPKDDADGTPPPPPNGPNDPRTPPSLINRWGEEPEEDDVRSPFEKPEPVRDDAPKHRADECDDATRTADDKDIADNATRPLNQDNATRPMRQDATRPLNQGEGSAVTRKISTHRRAQDDAGEGAPGGGEPTGDEPDAKDTRR